MRCLSLLAAIVILFVPAAAAHALAAADLPAEPPAERVLDRSAVLSRATRGEVEHLLDAFSQDRVDARLLTLTRLDYGLTLDDLGRQLVERWSPPAGSSADPLLLLLIDTQTKATAIVAAPPLERQLPVDLLRSTARTTMALPLKEGDRYRQAMVDSLERLGTVLDGGEDPGEPELEAAPVVASNIPSREETANSNGFLWVVVLLVVGTIVPMLTWWVFSR